MRDALYFSPFRAESLPAFHVDRQENTWFDFATGCGGDVVDFACAFLESRGRSHSLEDGLHFLHPLSETSYFYSDFTAQARRKKPRLTVKEDSRLRHPDLCRFLSEDKGIPLDLARLHLREVQVRDKDSGQVFYAIGMKNDNGGTAICNRLVNGVVGRPDVTVIRGARFPARDVHVFQDCFDLLTALADLGATRLPGDCIVLHNMSCLSNALPYIAEYELYERMFSWMRNTRTGGKATEIFRRAAGRENHLAFCDMTPTYQGFESITACRSHRLNCGAML